MAGRVAPFIELGVGFNPELTARENGVLNGVLMGLTLREARRSLDAVLEFAELEDFVDLKLKNYSSGMMVRFAFAVMVQADADIMLIDEVLAVGDAAFAQKCMDVFREKRRAGKTIVLVTHDMTTVQTLCHRAMLLHDGELRYIGEPEDAALRYYRMNFARRGGRRRRPATAPRSSTSTRASCTRRCATRRASAVENVEEGAPIVLDVVLEAARALDAPALHLPRAQRRRPGRLRVRRAGSTQRVAAGRPRAARRHGREPARRRAATRSTCTSREDDERGRHDRAGPAAAALRRLRHAAGARHRLGARRRRAGAARRRRE